MDQDLGKNAAAHNAAEVSEEEYKLESKVRYRTESEDERLNKDINYQNTYSQ